MGEPIRVLVNGACGRMGRTLIRLIDDESDLRLAGALESPDHPDIGRDVAETIGAGPSGLKISPDLSEADVLIDFSAPESSAQRARECAEMGIGLVVGTTGHDAVQMDAIQEASNRVPCVQASNMSLGIVIATKLVAELARSLPAGFDVEIVEIHHRDKKDAPSGTALRLARAIARARGEEEPSLVYGRRGKSGSRSPNEIALHALRMGDVTGEHRVIFAGPGERLEIGHVAHTREAFARGALRAARFVRGRSPGLYDISDVISGA